jgi:hypothetical protein
MANILRHIHVKVIEKKLEGDQWSALMVQPSGEKQWVEQPYEPNIGEEQIVYLVDEKSIVHQVISDMLEDGLPSEMIKLTVALYAMLEGAWCEAPWGACHTVVLQAKGNGAGEN